MAPPFPIDDCTMDVGTLAALTRSLVPGIEERVAPSVPRVVSANSTTWNQEALRFEQEPDRIWLVQETHLSVSAMMPYPVSRLKRTRRAYAFTGDKEQSTRSPSGPLDEWPSWRLSIGAAEASKNFPFRVVGLCWLGFRGPRVRFSLDPFISSRLLGCSVTRTPTSSQPSSWSSKDARNGFWGATGTAPGRFPQNRGGSSEGVATCETGKTLDYNIVSEDLDGIGNPGTS